MDHNPSKGDMLAALSALGYTGPTSYLKPKLAEILAQAKIDATARAVAQRAAEPDYPRQPATEPARPFGRAGCVWRSGGLEDRRWSRSGIRLRGDGPEIVRGRVDRETWVVT